MPLTVKAGEIAAKLLSCDISNPKRRTLFINSFLRTLEQGGYRLLAPEEVIVFGAVRGDPPHDQVAGKLHVAAARAVLHDRLQGMRVRRVADVVHEGGRPHRVEGILYRTTK